jgi:hypothetical protein
VGLAEVNGVSRRIKMGKLKGIKRKFKNVTQTEEEISDNEVPSKVRSSDEPVPKKVNKLNLY